MSVVMPCLDEADTVATCVSKACRALAEGGIAGEVIVADNGSIAYSGTLASREVEIADRAIRELPASAYRDSLLNLLAFAVGRDR